MITHVVFGAAGHIDHGKTTLVKALTGRDLDTLAEEKRRGITISPGFTWIDLGGIKAGMIDVPGHERFIKNMIAGAAGIDSVMLVVAATEGVKPQTLEHLEILETLGLSGGVVVLTKCAQADGLMLELCKEDVRDHVKGTFLESAPVARVDSVTGMGVEDLRGILRGIAKNINRRGAGGNARLNIDRVFVKKGFGAVVTGTLSEGRVSAGDELVLYPENVKVRARGVQVHETDVEAAFAGQRSAINLSGVKPADIKRGDVLAKPDSMDGTRALDVRLRLYGRSGRDVKFWDRLRVYIGTREVFCRAAPFDGEIKAGGEGYCQLRLEEEVYCKKDDRFVARLYSPMETVGGGVILDTKPKKHSRMTDALLESLKTKDTGDLKDIIESFLLDVSRGDRCPTDAKKAAASAGCGAKEASDALSALAGDGLAVNISGAYYHADCIDGLREDVLDALKKYHAKNPLKPGMKKEQLKSKLFPKPVQRDADAIIEMFVKEDLIKLKNSDAALASFEVRLTPEQKAAGDEILAKLLTGGFSPPGVAELVGQSKIKSEVLEVLSGGEIISLDTNTVMHVHYYRKAKNAAADYLTGNGEMTLAQFRDLLGTSRKYAQLLLERFDDERVTVRTGETRRLAKPKHTLAED